MDHYEKPLSRLERAMGIKPMTSTLMVGSHPPSSKTSILRRADPRALPRTPEAGCQRQDESFILRINPPNSKTSTPAPN